MSPREGITLRPRGTQVTEQTASWGVELQMRSTEGFKALALLQLNSFWQCLVLDEFQQLDGWPSPFPFNDQIQIFVGGAFAQEPVAHSTTHHAET